MQLKRLRETQDNLTWPADSNDLPVVNWESCTLYLSLSHCLLLIYAPDQSQAAERPLILVSGFIHDVSAFIEEHPGGAHLIVKFIGKDATAAFFGGVYDHSNAAHNVCPSFLRSFPF